MNKKEINHLTLVRMAITKSPQITNAEEVWEERALSYTVSGTENWYSYYGG